MRAEGREPISPPLTNNRDGRNIRGRSATGRQSIIEGGKKLNVGAASRSEANQRGDRHSNGSEAGQHRVVLDLSDETMVIKTLRVLMQQMVKLRRRCERECGQPEDQHRADDKELANSTQPL